MKLFCQIYQNNSSFTDGAVRATEAKINGFTGEVEPCQTGLK
jgi:hypothetical protein